MSWKYQPSETVWALVSDADTLYGGNVWFQTVERGDVYAVQCYFDSLHWFTFRFHSEGLSLAGYDVGTIYQLRALLPLLIATFPRGI